MVKASGLGKGLKALITDTEDGTTLLDVDLNLISPNPSQPRRFFDEDKLEELAHSIRENGLVQPIIVRKLGTMYEIIAGERRWRASKAAGLRTVPVIVRNITDIDAMRIALLENLQREDLNPLEEADAYRTLIEEYRMTQEALAESLGKNRSTIANAMRLLNLPQLVRRMLEESIISMGHARAILALEDADEQVMVAQRVVDDGLTVRDVEKLIQRIKKNVSRGTKQVPNTVDLECRKVEDMLRSSLGTKVRLIQSKGGSRGRILIEFFSKDELDRLLEALTPTK